MDFILYFDLETLSFRLKGDVSGISAASHPQYRLRWANPHESRLKRSGIVHAQAHTVQRRGVLWNVVYPCWNINDIDNHLKLVIDYI